MKKTKTRIALAGLAVMLVAAPAEARPERPRNLGLGVEVRNGDWISMDALGLVLIAGADDGPNLAGTVRGVLGLGGSGGGIGLATGLGGRCLGSARCSVRDSVFSSIIGVEARVERMYGPTSWRRTTYAGPQVSFGGKVLRMSVGWMFDLHDGSDHHLQLGFGGGW